MSGHALVTGCAGFIGSHLVERLLAEGVRVTGVDLFTSYYDPALKRRNLSAALGQPGFSLLELDLGRDDLARLPEADVVFHQAAQPGVRSSWGAEFASYVHHNVLATQRLLERYRGTALQRFVYASSSSVYGDAERYPTGEDLPPRPFSPYGVTKLAGEHLALLYARNFGLPVASLRYFTVYGPRQRPDMAFHRFCRALLTGQPITIYGDGRQSRDFTYIAQRGRRLPGRGAGGDPDPGTHAGREGGAAARAAAARGSAAHPGRRHPHPRGARFCAGDADRAGSGARGRVGARAVREGGGVTAWREPASGPAPAAPAAGAPAVSVVVPAYEEAESLAELQRELAAALDALGRSWEVLYVTARATAPIA